MTLTILAAVRFDGVGAFWWLWLVGIALAAVFLWWTYRGIFQRSGRKLSWWLLALRGVGIVLLMLMLAKPSWTRETDEVDPGRVAIIVDNSLSMSLPDESGVSRYERTKEAALALKKMLESDTKQAKLAVDFFDINGRKLKELPKEPTAEATNLTKVLRKTLSGLKARPVAGVILISDGVDTSGRPSFADWTDADRPIHTVGFARAVEIDLAVRQPQAERRVMVHNTTSIKVPVVKKGGPGGEVTVSVRRGRDVLASKKINMPKGDAEELVELSYKPDQAGSFELTAAVEGKTGEKDASNNAINFPLEVVKDPIRVLYIEGFLRSEYTFLQRHFSERDPDVTLMPVLRRAAPEDAPKRLDEGVLTAKILDKIDVVILGDLEADYLSAAQYQALTKWLDGKNHSLLVLGGYASFGAKGFRTNATFAKLLPVVFASGDDAQVEKPFRLKLTDKGVKHPIFTVSSDSVRTAKMWTDAPLLDGMCLVARARPGADILAVNPDVLVEGKPAVAVAVQRAPGGGQVMVLGLDTTWNWTRLPRVFGRDDPLYARFWSQAIRWLAGRAMDEGKPVLGVRTGSAVHERDKKAIVRIVRQARPGLDLTGSELKVEITDPKNRSLPGLVVKTDPGDPDSSSVEFYPTQAGRYDIAVSLKAGGKTLAHQNGELLVRGSALELASTGTRPENLRAISSATGGTFVEIGKEDELTDRIDRIERRRVSVKRTEYWNSPWLFAAFLGIVTGEWFLRRRNHLV